MAISRCNPPPPLGYDEGMSDESEKPRPRRRGTLLISFFLILMLAIYPLSSGPLQVLANRSVVSQLTVIKLYRPLNWLTGMTGTDDMHFRYVHWWLKVTSTNPYESQ